MEDKAKVAFSNFTKIKLTVVRWVLTADIPVRYSNVLRTAPWYSFFVQKPYKVVLSSTDQPNIIHKFPIILWNIWIQVYMKMYDTYGAFSTVPNLYLYFER